MARRTLGLVASAVFVFSLLSVVAGVNVATATTYDFSSGPGPEFEVLNIGGLWTVGTSGPDLPISKPEDPLAVNPTTTIIGGIRSLFCLDGDFIITVDFQNVDFPVDGSTPMTLNESVIALTPDSTCTEDFCFFLRFAVLRFNRGDGLQAIEAVGEQGPVGVQPSGLSNGRYRITRVGDLITGSFAEAGSEIFTVLGSQTGFQGPSRLAIFGQQSRNNGGTLQRAHTSLDIHFDNLIVNPDPVICGAIPVKPMTWGRLKTIYR